MNTDAELIAVAALVQWDAAIGMAEVAQFGQRQLEPNYEAVQALDAMLRLRGVLPMRQG